MSFLVQVEPFFVTLALYDAMKGRKISEDFNVDLNTAELRRMVASSQRPSPAAGSRGEGGLDVASMANNVREVRALHCGLTGLLTVLLLRECTDDPSLVSPYVYSAHYSELSAYLSLLSMQAVFSVMFPHAEVYLVVRVDKVFQGSIQSCAEPYIKQGDSTKASFIELVPVVHLIQVSWTKEKDKQCQTQERGLS